MSMAYRALLLALSATAGLTMSATAADEPFRRLVIGGDCLQCDFADSNLAGRTVSGR
jgi:hypothetical protein